MSFYPLGGAKSFAFIVPLLILIHPVKFCRHHFHFPNLISLILYVMISMQITKLTNQYQNKHI